MAGIKWIIHDKNDEIIQHIFFNEEKHSICLGTEEIDGPEIYLTRNEYLYFCVSFDADRNEYLVITDFDGPFIKCSRGKIFRYEKDTFVLL